MPIKSTLINAFKLIVILLYSLLSFNKTENLHIYLLKSEDSIHIQSLQLDNTKRLDTNRDLFERFDI